MAQRAVGGQGGRPPGNRLRGRGTTRLLEAVRSHWGIGNSLHWSPDTAFGEDQCRVRKDNGPENMAALRQRSHNLLQLWHVFSREGSLALDQAQISGYLDKPQAAREWMEQVSGSVEGLRVLTGDSLYAEADLCQAILDQGEDYLVKLKSRLRLYQNVEARCRNGPRKGPFSHLRLVATTGFEPVT